MEYIAHDVLSVFLLDGSSSKEIGYFDGQTLKSRTAGIAEKVLIHSLNVFYVSGQESFHHRAELTFIDWKPLVANVERFAGVFLLSLGLLVRHDDPAKDLRIVIAISRMGDKVLWNQVGAKVRVVGKAFLTCLNRVDHVLAVAYSSAN